MAISIHVSRVNRKPIATMPNRPIAIATACNQYAWLVSNTFGDFDKAIRASHKSVEVRQELKREVGAYYDTLGRCYYAKREFDNAIKYQTQALKLDPHSGQMKRQLALFQKAKHRGESFEQAMQKMLRPVLVAPRFLYRFEASEAAKKSETVGLGTRVTNHELAVRLCSPSCASRMARARR